MPKCKLCLVDVPKLSKSHIIPKSLYGAAFESPSGPPRIFSSAKNSRPVRSRAGEYDDNLLCAACEASLAPFDQYAHEIFFLRKPDRSLLDGIEEVASMYDDVDVPKLRTFFASLVWRMHQTDRPMFRAVKLGVYAENFRSATKLLDAGKVPQMDVVVTKFDKEDTAMLGPTKLRIENVNGYRFCFSGYTCWIKVDNRRFPNSFDEVAFSATDKQLRVLRTDFVTSPERVAMSRLVAKNR